MEEHLSAYSSGSMALARVKPITNLRGKEEGL
jgi:hypothetical protein